METTYIFNNKRIVKPTSYIQCYISLCSISLHHCTESKYLGQVFGRIIPNRSNHWEIWVRVPINGKFFPYLLSKKTKSSGSSSVHNFSLWKQKYWSYIPTKHITFSFPCQPSSQFLVGFLFLPHKKISHYSII